jgi:hypothetical protein
MIYVKGDYGTFVVDRKVSPSDGSGLYSSGTSEATFSGIRQSKDNTQFTVEWRSGRRQDDRSQSNVQRNRLRLHDNQWF